MYSLVKFHSDERVDLPDMEQATGLLDLFDDMRKSRVWRLPAGRNGGGAATECRILDGFDIPTALPSATLKLNRGSAIGKIVERGALYFGLLAGEEGAASQIIDVSGLPNDTFAVYVRFAFVDATNENRVFWDPAGSEYVSNVASRREMTWSYQVVSTGASAPSGGDWIKVAELTVAGGSCSVVADYRHFYFEGDATAGGGQWADEWGTGTDRNANRATYGVKDWHRAWQAARGQFNALLGVDYEWYEAPDPDLTDLAVEHHTDGRHLEIHALNLSLSNRTGGPPDSEWIVETNVAGGEHEFTMYAADQAGGAPLGEASILIADAGTHARYAQNPRGYQTALTDNDYGELCTVGPDAAGNRHGIRSTQLAIATNYFEHEIGELSGTPPLSIIEGGLTATVKGAHLQETGARYFHASRKEWNWVGWNSGVLFGANWIDASNSSWSDNGGSSGGILMLDTDDWPQWMQLDDIQVKIDLGAGAVAPLTVTAYRRTWQTGATLPTNVLLGSISTTTAGVQDLVISLAGSADWMHSVDRLYIEVSASDAISIVHLPRLRWTFDTVSKWAQ